MKTILLLLKRVFGLVIRIFFLNDTYCFRCYCPAYIAKPHHTHFVSSGLRGCFPLCETCWSQLNPEKRLPYYRKVLMRWYDRGAEMEVKWEDMKSAVLNEQGE